MCIVVGLESLAESGTERAVVDRAANLKQEIGTSSRPSHSLRFVHPAVHQKIGRPLGDRGTYSQSGTVSLGAIDHPIALAGEISIQRVQCGPKFSRGRDGISHTRLALKMMHHRADAIDADWPERTKRPDFSGETVQNLGVKVPLAAIAPRRPATSTADSGCREKFVSGVDVPSCNRSPPGFGRSPRPSASLRSIRTAKSRA
jgi:hypothetical protein